MLPEKLSKFKYVHKNGQMKLKTTSSIRFNIEYKNTHPTIRVK